MLGKSDVGHANRCGRREVGYPKGVNVAELYLTGPDPQLTGGQIGKRKKARSRAVWKKDEPNLFLRFYFEAMNPGRSQNRSDPD